MLGANDALQNASRRRRHAHALFPSSPHRRRHHHHLQAQRPLRRSRAEEARLVHARLAQGTSRPTWTRICSICCGRPIARSARRSRSMSSAAIVRRKPIRCCARARAASRSSASTSTARRWISSSPACRWKKSARSACGCSAAASDSIRPPARPSCIMDTGTIRHWPRMTHDQLAKVFPDGRTVHIPSDGHPLARLCACACRRRTAWRHAFGDLAGSRARSRRDHRERGGTCGRKPKRSLLARLFGAARTLTKSTRTPKHDQQHCAHAFAVASLTPPKATPVSVEHIVPLPTARPKRRCHCSRCAECRASDGDCIARQQRVR